MFALIFFLIGWCLLTLGGGIAGIGRFFPPILVFAPLLSGYIGPALFIYTKQLITPHRPANLKWLLLGLFGTTHSILALTIPNGLDPAIQSIIHKRPYVHPLLSPIMFIHGIQLISFILLSTLLITKAYIKKRSLDLRKTQFWLMIICWTTLVIIIFTNILPTFKIIVTEIPPAIVTLPIAFVGGLSIKSLGEESAKIQMSQIQERATRMDSLGRLARGIAHDLNNILSTILGHAEMARIKTQTESKTANHLDQVIDGTQRAAMLIDRMLTYSGNGYASTQQIEPYAKVKSLFQSISTLQPSNIDMKLEISADLPPIKMDETELDSAILNLLQNALQALGNNVGKVTMRVFYESCTTLPNDFVGHDINKIPSLRIEVEDNGRGMTDEEASRALEPFFSSRASGKGLGLVNVLYAVKGSGGALWFQSKKSIGTRFVLWIPAVTTTETPAATPVASQKSVSVLLVDDDAEVSTVLTELLQSIDIQAHHTIPIDKILVLLSEGSLPYFDVAVLDIRLGSVDGIELGHRLLNKQKVGSLLFISGDEPGERIQQFEGKNIRFLRKPIRRLQIKDTLAQLQQQSGLQEHNSSQ